MVPCHQRLSSIKGCPRSNVILNWRLSSIKGCLPLKVIFHWRSSSWKVVFHQMSFQSKVVRPLRSSSIKSRLSSKVIIKGFKCNLPSKVIFNHRLDSIKGWYPLKVIFHQRSSSVQGCPPSKGVFNKGHLQLQVIFHKGLSSIKHLLLSKVLFHRILTFIKLSSRVKFQTSILLPSGRFGLGFFL